MVTLSIRVSLAIPFWGLTDDLSIFCLKWDVSVLVYGKALCCFYVWRIGKTVEMCYSARYNFFAYRLHNKFIYILLPFMIKYCVYGISIIIVLFSLTGRS
ncbi:hypothetical protein KsCSTR_04320 [Candidatus Kuenenia stuttgartiensis]|uniref:Uncharacterized protein n=1 Tax=Kuenenia stuttgartiensis TaxID=174633 RepID=Q1Q0E7_KUEST|nr:hypothetical protein KsCSTR_04320 [Candidatus Kuenenia stuttgartiensis]CAJ72808.1 unknown protein [Candidatus Kuenenia stuttgartiensis]